MSMIDKLKDDPFSYRKCWECGKEKTPLFWIYRGTMIHVCTDCEEKEQ